MAGFDEAYGLLAPDPNADYGSILPFARDLTTGARRWAMPSVVREGLLGMTDLARSTQTGSLSGRGLETLLGSGLLGGGMLSPRGALASGGGAFRPAAFSNEELARIVPAVKHEFHDGRVTIHAAERGETHLEAAMKAGDELGDVPNKALKSFDDGFYDPQTRQYYTRDQMSERMGPSESGELADVQEQLSGGQVY